MAYEAHPSAVIEPDAEIGDGSCIWHFCHIMNGAQIGQGCTLGQGCFVADGAVVESGVKIQNNVSVYRGVVIKERAFVGPGVVFTNVKTPRAFISRRGEYLTTTIMQGASVGGGAVIVCGVTVGRYAVVGAGAVVTKSLPDYAVAVGNPAHIVGRACRCGAVIRGSGANCRECEARLNNARGDARLCDTL